MLRLALASQTLAGDGKSSPISPPLTPEEIADRFPGFEILECLGRGGMGVVYKARQKSLDRWVAIKIVAPEKHGEEMFSGRFAREAAMLAKLSHPNIVTIHDFGETDRLFFIVMEYVDGVNLRDLVSDGRLAPEQALAIVPPICEALQYAHEKGVVHRDIKPENILLDRDGRVRIADFGIASLMGGPGDPAGTPPYAAPEQTVPNATADHRADIHALGVVFYEMLTGERPSGEILAPSKRVDTDSRLDDMVLRAMAKDPAERFQTAAEFRTLLDTIGKPTEAATKRIGLRRWLYPATAIILLGLVGFLSWKLMDPPAASSVSKPDQDKPEMEPAPDISTMELDDFDSLREMRLTPDKAAILMGRARTEIKSETQRSRLASIVISMLCNKGHEDEAWNLISPEAGKVRENQVAGWFASCKVGLNERLKRIETLRNSTERKHAFRILFNHNTSVDEICRTDFIAIPVKSNEERRMILYGLHNVVNPDSNPVMKTEDGIRLLDIGVRLRPGCLISREISGFACPVGRAWDRDQTRWLRRGFGL
ncbi:MAG: serine/threonine protein kinase [Verrucomicrobiae bacterium]|nr:serine/threonine protein kinase [Verrucomicrobiae bacterium]